MKFIKNNLKADANFVDGQGKIGIINAQPFMTPY